MTTNECLREDLGRPTPEVAPQPDCLLAGESAAENHPLALLLKAPQQLLRRITEDDHLPPLAARLLGWGLVFHAVYGLAMGAFGSTRVALLTCAKAPLIAAASLLLCLPSLYVFSCVAGLTLTLSQALSLGAASVAMAGLLLLGLTPVAWLFSASTNSLPFVVVMNLLAWNIAVGFVAKFLDRIGRTNPALKTAGLKWWLAIYIIVTLQMATCLRPLLTRQETGWHTPGKKFFLAHFRDSLTTEKPKSNPPPPKAN